MRDPQRRHTQRLDRIVECVLQAELPIVASQIGMCITSCPQSSQRMRHRRQPDEAFQASAAANGQFERGGLWNSRCVELARDHNQLF